MEVAERFNPAATGMSFSRATISVSKSLAMHLSASVTLCAALTFSGPCAHAQLMEQTGQASEQSSTQQAAGSAVQATASRSSQSNSKGNSQAKQTGSATGINRTAPHKKKSPPKTIVREGGTIEPLEQIGPSVPSRQATGELKNTDRLLAMTSDNLKALSNRQLTAPENDEMTEIKAYIAQARTAATNGDTQRAYNLAHKANLLSSDLLKQ